MITQGTHAIRLSETEKTGILRAVEAAAERLGFRWTSIAIFGSRADPGKKGGDIDLYVGLQPGSTASLFEIRQSVRREIEDRLGEQKVDIVLDDGVADLGSFREIIAKQKRDLWTQH